MSESFDAFARRAHPALLRLALALCGGSFPDAEDLEQAVLEKLYARWPLPGVADTVAYAKRTLVREQISIRRRIRWRLEVLSESVPVLGTEDPALRALDDRMPLMEALRRLPERQRQAVVLHYLEDLTIPATAQVLGCSPGTIKRAAHDGIRALRKSLDSLDQERDHT